VPYDFDRERINSMIGRILLAVLFILSGSLHFIAPRLYLKIVPPILPAPLAIVYISGVAEISAVSASSCDPRATQLLGD
jgi:uncharacterized membrane protein